MSDKPTEQQTPIRSRSKKSTRRRVTETQSELSEPTRVSKTTKRPRETDDQTEKNEIVTPPQKKTKVTVTSPNHVGETFPRRPFKPVQNSRIGRYSNVKT
jgi:hypothetical protein